MKVLIKGGRSADSLFPRRIETGRLCFEQFSAANTTVTELSEFFSSITDEDEHIVYTLPENVHETRKMLRTLEQDWDEGKRATYLLRPKDDDSETRDLAGFVNIRCDWERQVGQVGSFLHKDCWGRGYTPEAGVVRWKIALDVLELDTIEIECATSNENARRTVQKQVDELGGRYVGVIPNKLISDAGEPVDAHLFTVTQEEFSASQHEYTFVSSETTDE
jgi:RimJ/RimL family protein N-acetyltransferase